MPDECSQNTDSLKLVREGTAQDERSPRALDPALVPVNEHGVAHNMVFAQGYAALLKYFDAANNFAGDWSPFFNKDVSQLLAVPAIEDVDAYKRHLQEWFGFLNELENKNNENGLKLNFGYLYASIASLARQLDNLRISLPDNAALKAKLENLIKTQLKPAFQRLISYYKAGSGPPPNHLIPDTDPPDIQILRQPAVSFGTVMTDGLSSDWSGGVIWGTYVAGITPDASVYGDGADTFTKINHCSTHTLFKAIFDQFLKVFAGVVSGAKDALSNTLTNDDSHEPHCALFLAFLRLLEYARASGNTLTRKHLDFYYRTILRLQEKSSQPGHVHLLVELAKKVMSREFKAGEAGEAFRAGKDDRGKDVFFANERDFVANQAKVAARCSLYRHNDEPVNGSAVHEGRLFASPVANSDDGLGAPLTSPDGSWHPFFNKVYGDGKLKEIRMPEAEVGFAIASHYLLMAGGHRVVAAYIAVSGYNGPVADFTQDVRCLVTTEKGWTQIQAATFHATSASQFLLGLHIDGSQPAIVPYVAKTHGYNFQTGQPMLLVKLKQEDARPYKYSAFQNVVITGVELSAGVAAWPEVGGLKLLAASNDFGPVDTSKPFQPFGASPIAGSSLLIGSKEIFQKKLSWLRFDLDWMSPPAIYPAKADKPNVVFEVLTAGQWKGTSGPVSVASTGFEFTHEGDLDETVQDEPDYSANEFFSAQSRKGYVRLRLTGGFGQDAYQAQLIKYLKTKNENDNPGPKPPTGPVATSLSARYAANLNMALNTADQKNYEERSGQFFHLAPFGTAEQHPFLQGGGDVFLFPQFGFKRNGTALPSEAEFYIGVSGLAPPQNISLLIQVADGTANPLAPKPHPHIDWSYLRKNQWVEFQTNEVQDATGELLNSGIVAVPVPRDATDDNTLLTAGLYWIRAAVHERSDAICRLQLVAAQATQAVFADRGNSPTFSATPLPAGIISKLEMPDAEVKSIKQPFPSFGGRGAEQSPAFYTRISERLRHKDRAIDLWNYERLILEKFPQIYKVKCLNHTCYEPSETGGTYRELAPGHVTIITIPNLHNQKQRDPLKPYTSLGTLDEIRQFLESRSSCFAQLHVKNPQFEEVRVRFSVRLYEGFDESYYSRQLQQAITRYLSPWAFSRDARAPSFGGRVYKSVLINFVEDQRYVDYVTDFQLFQDINGKTGTVDLDEVAGSLAVSVLVSAPASKHEVTVIDPGQVEALGESCACDA